MKELNPVVSFLAFFFVLICLVDLILPYKGEQIHVFNTVGDKNIEITPQNKDQYLTKYNKGQLVWRESTRILHQPMRYSYVHGNKIRTNKSDFNFYIPGVVFIVFLAFGGVFGVFFKKSLYQEKRVMTYNLIVGFIISLMYIISLDKVV